MPVDDGKNKRRYIRFGDKGSPDFLVWIPGVIYAWPTVVGVKILRAVALEAKSESGKQSKDQQEWQASFEVMGGEYYIVRSLEEAINKIEGR